MGDIQQKDEVQNFEHELGEPFLVPPVVKNPDPHIKNTLRSELRRIAVIILKRVREIIFFQSYKFTVFKVGNGKEVAKSLMYLKTYWNPEISSLV